MWDFTTSQRRAAHRAGISNDYGERDADWIARIAGGSSSVNSIVATRPNEDVSDQLEDAVGRITEAGYGAILLPPSMPVVYTRPIILPTNEFGSPGYAIWGRGGTQMTYKPSEEFWTSSGIEIGDLVGIQDVTVEVSLKDFQLVSGTTEAEALAGANHGGIKMAVVVGGRITELLVQGFGLYMSTGDGISVIGSIAHSADSFAIDVVNTTCNANKRGFYATNSANINFYSLKCTQNIDVDCDLQAMSSVAWFGGDVEGNAPYGIRITSGAGAESCKNISITGLYNESSATSRHVVHIDGNAGSVDSTSIKHCRFSGPSNANFHAVHFEGCNDVHLENCLFPVSAPGKSIFARNTLGLKLDIDASDGSTLDFDTATTNAAITRGTTPNNTRAAVSIGSGILANNVALQVNGGAVALPTYALGSEPTGVPERSIIFCTTTKRVAMLSNGIWQQVAFVDDQPEIALGQYLVEYWDTEDDAKIGLVGGAVNTWTGYLTGTVLTAASAGARPAYAVDSDFANHKTVQFSSSGTEDQLQNLAISPALLTTADEYTFVVIVKWTPGVTQENIVHVSGTGTNNIAATGNDGAGNFTGKVFNPGLITTVTDAATTDVTFLAHVVEAGGGSHHLYANGVIGTLGACWSTVPFDLTQMSLGATIGGGQGINAHIAAVYLLRGDPGSLALDLAYSYARNRYGF